jgi:hypothetical protein
MSHFQLENIFKTFLLFDEEVCSQVRLITRKIGQEELEGRTENIHGSNFMLMDK